MDTATEITLPEGLVKPAVSVPYGANAYEIMGVVREALIAAKNSEEVITSYIKQSTLGDYDYLQSVARAFTK